MKDILVDNKFIYNLELKFIKIFSIITQIIVFLFIIGFFQEKPTEFLVINSFVKILISFFLIYRFNNYRKNIKFTELDRKVIYSAALYIIIISFADILNKYIEIIRTYIYKFTKPIVTKIKEIIYGKEYDSEIKSESENVVKNNLII
jgi:hypothetical protein